MDISSSKASWDGMLPSHPCKGCGKPLNQDHGHPAELYAGTYTGLCYDCERKGPYVVQEFYDGGKRVSHPPSCPSYRRDRVDYFWYPDCQKCEKGTLWEYRSSLPGWGGDSFRTSCPACLHRHTAWIEDRLQRKLRGQTPYEELAAHFLAMAQTQSLEAKKRVTKTRTKERKEWFSLLAVDYKRLADLLRGAVWSDNEESLPDLLEKRSKQAEQRIAAGQVNIPFSNEWLACLRAAAEEVRQALPAQRVAKRRQTQVLV